MSCTFAQPAAAEATLTLLGSTEEEHTARDGYQLRGQIDRLHLTGHACGTLSALPAARGRPSAGSDRLLRVAHLR